MLGFHVRAEDDLADNLRTSIKILTDYGFMPCAQIFVVGPQSYKSIKMDRERIKQISRETNIIVHGAFIDFPWNDRPSAIQNICREMKIAHQIGATGLVVHLGIGADGPLLKKVLGQIAKCARGVTLWLEINAAVPSDYTFETPKKINRLWKNISAVAGDLSVGLCIDTAHLYSCGVSLRTYNNAMEWLGGLPDCPYMIHLNDSSSEMGSGRDVHAALTKGNIWGDYDPAKLDSLPLGESGLAAICMWANKSNIVTILERKQEYIPADLRLLYDMHVFTRVV